MVVEVRDLCKSYGDIPALKKINFVVNEGEIFGFLGPNGAGKTTTIRLLLQLLNPDEGEIFLFKQPISSPNFQHRNRLGYLPGYFQPPAEMKVSYYLDYVARFRAREPILRDPLIKQLKMSERDLGKKIKYLSHGTRQKLGLISALEHDPDLVILDEPTLGLDPLMQEAFFEIILEFKQKQKTVFLSSHVLSEVERICSRVAIIRQGEIITEAPLHEIKQKHRRRLVVEFDKVFDESPPEIEGAKLIQCTARRCVFLVESETKNILQQLATLPVKDIIFPEPELEDIFLTYYKEH